MMPHRQNYHTLAGNGKEDAKLAAPFAKQQLAYLAGKPVAFGCEAMSLRITCQRLDLGDQVIPPSNSRQRQAGFDPEIGIFQLLLSVRCVFNLEAHSSRKR